MSVFTERALQELGKRRASLGKKHEAELNALKMRQKREMDALELRYSSAVMSEKNSATEH